MLSSLLALSLVLGDTAQADPPPEPTRTMVKAIARAHRCEADTTAAEYIREERVAGFVASGWVVTGCGGEPFMMAMLNNGLRWLPSVDDLTLRRKAPFDLTCDAEDVTYAYIDYVTRGVVGCGRQLTYVYVDRQWIANVAAN